MILPDRQQPKVLNTHFIYLVCCTLMKPNVSSLSHSLSLSLSVLSSLTGEVFDYLVAHGRMKEKEARAKFRQVRDIAVPKASVLLSRLPVQHDCLNIHDD